MIKNNKHSGVEDEKINQFTEIAAELKEWFEEKDIDTGYTDTNVGQLAILIQKKITAAQQEAVRGEIERLRVHIEREVIYPLTDTAKKEFEVMEAIDALRSVLREAEQ